MKRILSERNIVVVLFVMVLISFSLHRKIPERWKECTWVSMPERVPTDSWYTSPE
ncbi:MAG: hypothetical protein IPP43_13485 [Chitinophagaceae bacterium]|nr:hypothetical protein [Chitinophagaceae bacterium]